MSKHYPNGAGGWVEKCERAGYDIEAMTDAFLAEVRESGWPAASRVNEALPVLRDPSPAELEALSLAAEGFEYDEIASRLTKNIETIKTQLRAARKKLGARNGVHAVALAIRKELI